MTISSPSKADEFESVPFLVSLQAQLQNLRSWVFLMCVLFLTRLIWLWCLRDELPVDASLLDWGKFFFFGFRIDSVTVTVLMLPCVVIACLTAVIPALQRVHAWVRLSTVALFTILAPIIAFGNVEYYRQFGDIFDEFIFDFFNGNAAAIVTLSVEEYGLFPKTIGCLIFAVFCLVVYFRWLNGPIKPTGFLLRWSDFRIGQVGISMALMALVFVGYRGTVGPVRTQQIHSCITEFRVLNLGSLNGVYNLKTAVRSYRDKLRYFDRAQPIAPEDVMPTAAQLVARVQPNASVAEVQLSTLATEDLSGELLHAQGMYSREASGPPNAKPSHVFVLFLESYDSWAFQERFSELHLVDEGKALGREGHLVLKNLPAGNTSIESALACIQGMFGTYTGKQQCLPTSMVYGMKSLGYRTRSVNGFPRKWGDAERLAIEQGFEEVYCTEDLLPGGETSDNQLHDRTMFTLAAEKLDYDQPTFSFIRSSSYHVPYEVDLASEDCLVDPYPDAIGKLPKLHDEERMRTILGHFKYTDRAAGRFVREMSKRYPKSLFVITGDHFGRHYLTENPTIYEGSSVPLIFYGPEVLKNTEITANTVSSQIDLTTTLIELCAPQGHSYVSMGKNIFSPQKKPFGVGTNFVIFPDCVVDVRIPARCEPLPMPNQTTPDQTTMQARIEEATQLHAMYHSIGYMIARNSLEKELTHVAKNDESTKTR